MRSIPSIVVLLLLSGTRALQFNDKTYHPVPSFLKTTLQQQQRNNILEVLGPNKYTPEAEANTEYWLNLARDELKKRINEDALNNNEAKNIIFFVANGMSLSTATAARIRKGQLKGNTGEEDVLSWEQFPYMGLSKTYCTNAQIGDSACTATAYLSGIKTNMFTLGVTGKVNFNNCSESENPENRVTSLADWAQRAGKASGLITTGSVTHASSAALYAHAANRFWETDNDVSNWGNEPSQCMDIAQQLITQKPGNNFDLIMGGGMSKFLPQTLKDLHGNKGQRLDNKNLLSLWQGMHPHGIIVHNRQELFNLNTSKTSHIMGLFSSDHMGFHLKNKQNKEPSLLEMTEAVQKARDMTDAKDTLIVMSQIGRSFKYIRFLVGH
ncbi:hypothetical protein DOY81_008365 [Sarcophaga bullata]|nr:hypothetical protein DOY81_008365 [Sarcophaga bullata]